MRLRLITVAVILLPALARAQATADSTAPRAIAADVASVDAIIASLYDVISGPAGQARDWNRHSSRQARDSSPRAAPRTRRRVPRY